MRDGNARYFQARNFGNINKEEQPWKLIHFYKLKEKLDFDLYHRWKQSVYEMWLAIRISDTEW